MEIIVKEGQQSILKKKLFYPKGFIFQESDDDWNILHDVFFNTAFNPKLFHDKYSTVFDRNFNWLCKRWSLFEKPINLYHEITHFTMRTIAEALFGYRLADSDLKIMTYSFKYLLDTIQTQEVRLLKSPYWLPTKQNKQFKSCLNDFNRVLAKIIHHSGDGGSLITELKRYRHPKTGHHLSYNEIRGHVSTLFFAGHDTTANLIAMLLYQMHDHPGARDKIAAEILAKNPTAPGLSSMGEFPYYTRFKDEVLRLYPSVPIYSRQTKQELILGDYRIPANSMLIIAAHVINRHPRYYQSPNEFNPDRFCSIIGVRYGC